MLSPMTSTASGPGPRARDIRAKSALAAGALIAAATMGVMPGCGDRGGEPARPSSSSGSVPAFSGAPRSAAPPAPLTPPAAHASGADPYASSIQEERRQKDEFFRASPESPVPASERATFLPLDYYPVDSSWRMTLPVEPYAKPQTFELVTNLGERRVFRREGQVRFGRDGEALSLQLYRELEGGRESATFWVPFTDAGAGRETYPAGRYLDVTPNSDGSVTLDFNRAYNPYCAYGWAFSCPMAPPENRLKIAVRAGERGYHHP